MRSLRKSLPQMQAGVDDSKTRGETGEHPRANSRQLVAASHRPKVLPRLEGTPDGKTALFAAPMWPQRVAVLPMPALPSTVSYPITVPAWVLAPIACLFTVLLMLLLMQSQWNLLSLPTATTARMIQRTDSTGPLGTIDTVASNTPAVEVSSAGKSVFRFAKLSLSMTLHHLDYSKLAVKPFLVQAIEACVKKAIALEAGHRIGPEQVNLTLRPGSVVVDSILAVPAHIAAEVRSQLNASAALSRRVAEHLRILKGIEAVSTGFITVRKDAVMFCTPNYSLCRLEGDGAWQWNPMKPSFLKLESLLGLMLFALGLSAGLLCGSSGTRCESSKSVENEYAPTPQMAYTSSLLGFAESSTQPSSPSPVKASSVLAYPNLMRPIVLPPREDTCAFAKEEFGPGVDLETASSADSKRLAVAVQHGIKTSTSPTQTSSTASSSDPVADPHPEVAEVDAATDVSRIGGDITSTEGFSRTPQASGDGKASPQTENMKMWRAVSVELEIQRQVSWGDTPGAASRTPIRSPRIIRRIPNTPASKSTVSLG